MDRVAVRTEALVLIGVALGCFACAELAGIDEYEVGEGPRTNRCGDFEVPLAGGGCETVGAEQGACPDGFAMSDAACAPLFPAEACEPGSRAVPGQQTCRTVDNVCSSSGFGVFARPGDIFVAKGATGSGDSPESPLAAIALGIARAKERGLKNVWIAAGEYDEGPLIVDAPIMLNGSCPTAVRIRGGAAASVVEFRAGAEGGGLATITVEGGARGVHVVGVTGVVLQNVWITNVAGPGIVFEGTFDANAPSETGVLLPDGGIVPDAAVTSPDAGAGPGVGGRVSVVTIDRVQGSAVEVWGSDVELDDLSIRDVAPLDDLLPGRGIGVHASAVSNPSWEPRRSRAVIRNAAITGVTSAGILVEGSDVTVERSLVSGVSPDSQGKGRGVSVQPRIAANVPASLTAKHLLVENTHDVGVHVWSAKTSLDNVTIRDTGARSEAGCSGNGVRVRLDTTGKRTPDEPVLDEPLVDIIHSVIERTREAAVHVEGARVDITASIIRDTGVDNCTGGFGDGIVAYSFADSAADLRVARSRIERSARAGISSFDTPATLESSVLACNTQAIAQTEGERAVAPDAATLCGCGTAWAACQTSEDPTTARSLRSSSCADAARCSRECITDWFGTGGFTRVGRGTLWLVDDEHTAPAFTGSDGCVELSVGTGTVVGLSAPDYGYAVSPAGQGNLGLLRYPSFSRHMWFIESAQNYGKQFDFRTAYLAALIVCDGVDPVVSGEPQEACFGHGISGVRVALPGHAGRAVYQSEAFATDRSLSATTSAGGVLWQNVKLGKYEALVYPPDDAAGLKCGLWGGSAGRGETFPGTNPVSVPLRAYPGAQASIFVDCDVIR